MEYFLSIAGGQSGPHTQLEMIGRIRDGTLKGDELVWRKGFSEWTQLRKLNEFEDAWPVTQEMVQTAEKARDLARTALDTPQPWLRFWARMVDYMWFTVVLWLVLAAALPNAALHWLLSSLILGAPLAPMFLLAFVPMEAWLLSRRGTTPGKSLLLVQVRRLDGGLPTFKQALMRSLQVYVKGVALWMPFISLLVMSYWRLRLLRKKVTAWDETTELRVEHGEPEVWRYLLVPLLVFLTMLALGLLFSQSPEAEEMMRNLPK